MPFDTQQLITSVDVNNIFRGLTRDNSTASVTGPAAETDLKSYTILANTIGPTGHFRVLAAGTLSSAIGNRTMNLKFGGVTIASILSGGASANDWLFDANCFNVTANSQRWILFFNNGGGANFSFDYFTSAVDTTVNQILKLTGTPVAADTIAETMFNVFIAQIP